MQEGSVREWRDPSAWLSASAAAAAAGLMPAGERNGGADKAWVPAESIESTESSWNERAGYVRKAGNKRGRLKNRDLEKK